MALQVNREVLCIGHHVYEIVTLQRLEWLLAGVGLHEVVLHLAVCFGEVLFSF